MDPIDISALRPEQFFAEWTRVDDLEQRGEISEHEARRLKREIFAEMLRRGLRPDDVIPPGERLGF